MKLALFLAAASLVATAAHHDPIRPDPKLTPGATLNVTVAQICTPGYANGSKSGGPKKGARNVPQSEKNAVYKEYGITSHKPGEFEIDHLVPLSVGGSNDIHNLWAQSYVTHPLNAHVKDVLEDRLHALVCHGKVPLKEAQDAIRTDWVAAYTKYVGPLPK